MEIRESLGVRDWQKAQKLIRQWEDEGRHHAPIQAAEPVTLEQASQRFLADGEARGLREPTLYKYRLLLRQMLSFAKNSGFRYIKEFDLDALRQFRESWPNRNLSALKKLECMRAFFRFAHESGWIENNPATASKIKNPKIADRPTMPFTRARK